MESTETTPMTATQMADAADAMLREAELLALTEVVDAVVSATGGIHHPVTIGETYGKPEEGKVFGERCVGLTLVYNQHRRNIDPAPLNEQLGRAVELAIAPLLRDAAAHYHEVEDVELTLDEDGQPVLSIAPIYYD